MRLSKSSAIRSRFFVLASGEVTAHRWRAAEVRWEVRWRKLRDLEKSPEIGDRIVAGEEVFARVFSPSVLISFQLFVKSNGLRVAHLLRPIEKTTSANIKGDAPDQTEPNLKELKKVFHLL